MATKSGTNSFYGTAQKFFRNDHLDARGSFSTTELPSLTRNQYGGSLGGPERNSKTFFFATFECPGSKLASIATTTVPTLKQRKEDFSESSTQIKVNCVSTYQIPKAGADQRGEPGAPSLLAAADHRRADKQLYQHGCE